MALNQWDRVLFRNETKINLFSSDGRINVWRKEGEALLFKNSTPTVKHGGRMCDGLGMHVVFWGWEIGIYRWNNGSVCI